MTLTVTQDDISVPPIKLVLGGLPVTDSEATGEVTGIIQRRTDGVTWHTVRGAIDLEIDGSGNTDDVLDYEFRPEVLNEYRAGVGQEYVDIASGSASNSWGTLTTAQTWAGANAAYNKTGGFLTILHSAANTSFLNNISGLTDLGDMDFRGTFKTNASAGGITGATASVVLHAHRTGSSGYAVFVTFNTDDTMSFNVVTNINGDTVSMDTVALPNLYTANTQVFRWRWKIDGNRVRFKLWEPATQAQPDWLFDEVVPAGRRTAAGNFGVGSIRATSNTNSNLTFSFTDIVVETGTPKFLSGLTDDITPTLAGFWLVSTMRSFLNLAPQVVGFREPSRDDRGGALQIAGRTLPIGMSEVMTARGWTLTCRVPNVAMARQLEYLIASGDILYLLTPADCPIPMGYYRVRNMDPKRAIRAGSSRLFDLPIYEVAAPGPDVATSWNTFDSILAQYGTFENLLASGLTFEQVRDQVIGDPSEVIVE